MPQPVRGSDYCDSVKEGEVMGTDKNIERVKRSSVVILPPTGVAD